VLPDLGDADALAGNDMTSSDRERDTSDPRDRDTRGVSDGLENPLTPRLGAWCWAMIDNVFSPDLGEHGGVSGCEGRDETTCDLLVVLGHANELLARCGSGRSVDRMGRRRFCWSGGRAGPGSGQCASTVS